jgi:hypothetical protein
MASKPYYDPHSECLHQFCLSTSLYLNLFRVLGLPGAAAGVCLHARINVVGGREQEILAVCGVSNLPPWRSWSHHGSHHSGLGKHRGCLSASSLARGSVGFRILYLCIPATLIVHATVIDFFFFPFYH